ncbi:MAG TPA: peptide ABC transporter substrate-binding protein, partial [Methylomirabilota bacterium]|nr:peptide ABC transporter substrate-binding protein [Methylomirabilota bacterium]
VHLPTVEKHGTLDGRDNPWTRAGNFVGNGPFTLKEWKLNQIISVEKSSTYWDADTVRLKEIHFYPIENTDAEERAFRSGQLHVSYVVPLPKIEYYQREQPELLRIDPYLGSYFYRINVTKPPLDNPKVRRALAMAVDRRSIAENVTKAGQRPAHAMTYPGIGGYTPEASIPTDFDQARKLLAEAGYPEGRGFPPIEILFNTQESHKTIAEAIQQMWRKELNINATLVNQEWKVYLDTQKQLNYQICRAGWIGDYPDPKTFLDMWVTGGGNNDTGWSNAEYDRLIAEADRTADDAQRLEIYQRAEAILLEETPVIPIYYYTRVYLKHPAVQGWHPTLLDHHPYKHVYLEP